MAAISHLSLYDKFLNYLVEKATPEEILAFEVSPEEQEYVQELIFRNNEGTITPEEKALLEEIADFDLLVAALKAKALQVLSQS